MSETERRPSPVRRVAGGALRQILRPVLRPVVRPLARAAERLRRALADDSGRAVARRNAGLAFLIRVAGAAVAFVSQILLARWMGRFEFGIYVSVWTWASVLGPLAPLGLGYAAQRFVPDYRLHGDLAGLRGFLLGGRLLALAFGVVAGIVLAAVVVAFSGRPVPPHVVLPFAIGAATLPMLALGSTQDGISRAFDWFDLALIPVFVVQPLLVVAAVAGLHAAGRPVDAVAVLAVTCAAAWIVTALQTVLLRRRLRAKIPAGPRRHAPRAWLAVSLPIVLVDGFFLLLFYVDILVLQVFEPPQEVAIYFAASKTLALVHFIAYAVGAAVAHRFSAFHAQGDRAGLQRFVADAIRWSFWPTLAVGLMLVALGRPILSLFGPGFSAGYPVLVVIMLGLLARGAVGPADRLLNMTGHSSACALVYAVALAANLALCLILIPAFGPIGAAVAMAAAVVVESSLLFVMVRTRLGLHAFVLGRGRPIA
ncbi:lipopolysaccharide biosynthesis protein [Rhodovulum sp. PH10]|uniref:lipopolysaccharide biosynthesis protein n=1 Tax=Rhodovulum sp. PH10 TaxID=1187851 RepID=UPI00178C7005|nr:lipopolysaccharide biosynthesis protein [Rhodovulum sp. PH10]